MINTLKSGKGPDAFDELFWVFHRKRVTDAGYHFERRMGNEAGSIRAFPYGCQQIFGPGQQVHRVLDLLKLGSNVPG